MTGTVHLLLLIPVITRIKIPVIFNIVIARDHRHSGGIITAAPK